jgi:hypothetical protein
MCVTTAYADNPLGPACNTNDKAKNSAACTSAGGQGKKNPISGQDGVINKAVNVLAIVAGFAAVLFIIIGGFNYVTSAGNAENVTKAKNRIISALVGLVIIALAWTIITYVIDNIIQ